MTDSDRTSNLVEQVADAARRHQGIQIRGGGSKDFYGRSPINGQAYGLAGGAASSLEPLNVSEHSGIVNYEPTELVVTVRAGTTVAEINNILAEHGQCLPFEPPVLDGKATIGGSIACGLSGPARPYAGAARDFVLGMHVINGRGELLKVGGEVIKNVAGYDISRLMVGALGTLGLITRVSFKVLPDKPCHQTLIFHLERDSALTFMNDLAAQPIPVSASCFYEDILFIRLSGSESGVAHACEQLGGEALPSNDGIWDTLRDWQHPFFDTDLPVWRLALPALAAPDLDGKVLIEWGGGQWWLRSVAAPEVIRAEVSKAGGHATLFRGGDRTGEVFHPLPKSLEKLQRKIQRSFDPLGIFNPGRQYAGR